jgi:hypothetical protein
MIQAYQGYFKDGSFVSYEPVTIPENVEVYVMITEKELPSDKSISQRQREAMNKFVAANNAIDDEPLTEEFFHALENNRVSF